MKRADRPAKRPRLTADHVLGHLRKQNFAVLSTVGEDGRPSSAGVTYRMPGTGREPVLYVMTRRHLQKARNIERNPDVSLVVPLTRRLLWFLPPPTIQVRGRAEILESTDEQGTRAYRGFWLGRRILEAYRRSHRRGETRICFLKITLDPVISTYMVGSSILEISRRMESGAAKVVIPGLATRPA